MESNYIFQKVKNQEMENNFFPFFFQKVKITPYLFMVSNTLDQEVP